MGFGRQFVALSVIAALVAAPLHLAQAQSLEASLRMGGVERPPNQQPQDTISPWQTLTAIAHWVEREWPNVRDGAVAAAKATWEGTKWTGKKLWQGVRWVGKASKSVVCLGGLLCGGGGSSALQQAYDANLATRNAARAANTELRSAVTQADQGLATARGALQRTLADPAFAAAAGGAQAVRDQLRTLAATQVAQHNAAIAGLDRDLRGNWPQPTVPVAKPPVAPPPALDATAQPGPPSLTPSGTPQGRRLAEVQRYSRAADQFAQTSTTYRTERLALVRVAQSSLRFADASFAQGDASVADTLLETANGVLDNVFSLSQRAGQWLMQSRTATFLAGLINGATGIPMDPVEGLETSYYVGAALGSAAGMAADTWNVFKGLTVAAGSAVLTVTTAGVTVAIATPVAIAGLAQATLGVGLLPAHYERFKEAYALAKTADLGPSAGGQRLRALTERNFRLNLKRLTGTNPPSNVHAHHVFPETMANEFWKRLGLNVNDPRYGAWWDATPHLRNAWAYNQEWEIWFLKFPGATVQQALAFGRQLANTYGFTIRF